MHIETGNRHQLLIEGILMSDPVNHGLALLAGLLTIAVLALLFWPRGGLLGLWSRWRTANRRVLLEDALKFVYDCEYKKIAFGLDSLSGHLQIPADKAARLLDRLQSMGLIRGDGDSFRLTSTGRSYALRVVRVHRIWERYLADETGVRPDEWHDAADQMEHELSAEAADRLAGRIGNPVFDPHGDPIPSPEGKMPAPKGQSLSTLAPGESARIIHLEDEPQSIFAQLTALGLFPGMGVYVTESGDGKVSFVANGEEHVLTSLFASAITVHPTKKTIAGQEKYEVLSALQQGEQAEIRGISPNCPGQQRRRFMDLGIVPGTIVTADMKSPGGDPVAYRVMGAHIAIRKSQADCIFVRRLEKA